VALNRAVAVAEIRGPQQALELIDGLSLAEYYLYHAIRADLLRRLERPKDATAAYQAAINRTNNAAEITSCSDVSTLFRLPSMPRPPDPAAPEPEQLANRALRSPPRATGGWATDLLRPASGSSGQHPAWRGHEGSPGHHAVEADVQRGIGEDRDATPTWARCPGFPPGRLSG
jgi:hypothetical protein